MRASARAAWSVHRQAQDRSCSQHAYLLSIRWPCRDVANGVRSACRSATAVHEMLILISYRLNSVSIRVFLAVRETSDFAHQ